MSKKANEDMLNSLHLMTAIELTKLLESSKKEGNDELTLKVLKEIKAFLKDNNVTADIEVNRPLRELEQETIKVAELPFTVEDIDAY